MNPPLLHQLMQRRQCIRERVSIVEEELTALRKELDDVSQAILRTCQHEWHLDWKQELCAYDRRDTVCDLCGTRNVAFGW